ncbi:MAG: hypothetical protein ABIA93_02740 [Candidatus Woesearchaeota archaeon]
MRVGVIIPVLFLLLVVVSSETLAVTPPVTAGTPSYPYGADAWNVATRGDKTSNPTIYYAGETVNVGSFPFSRLSGSADQYSSILTKINDYSTIAGACSHNSENAEQSTDSNEGDCARTGDKYREFFWQTEVFIPAHVKKIRLVAWVDNDAAVYIAPYTRTGNTYNFDLLDFKPTSSKSIFYSPGNGGNIDVSNSKYGKGLILWGGSSCRSVAFGYAFFCKPDTPTHADLVQGADFQPGWNVLGIWYRDHEGGDHLTIKMLDPDKPEPETSDMLLEGIKLRTDMPLISYRSVFSAISTNSLADTVPAKHQNDGRSVNYISLRQAMGTREGDISGGCWDGIDNDGNWMAPKDLIDSEGRNYPDGIIQAAELKDPVTGSYLNDDHKLQTTEYTYNGTIINRPPVYYDTEYKTPSEGNLQPNIGEYGVDCLDKSCDGKPGPGGVTCNWADQSLSYPTESDCTDGEDNDFDGKIDLLDEDCLNAQCGIPPGTTISQIIDSLNSAEDTYDAGALDGSDACCGDDLPELGCASPEGQCSGTLNDCRGTPVDDFSRVCASKNGPDCNADYRCAWDGDYCWEAGCSDLSVDACKKLDGCSLKTCSDYNHSTCLSPQCSWEETCPAGTPQTYTTLGDLGYITPDGRYFCGKDSKDGAITYDGTGSWKWWDAQAMGSPFTIHEVKPETDVASNGEAWYYCTAPEFATDTEQKVEKWAILPEPSFVTGIVFGQYQQWPDRCTINETTKKCILNSEPDGFADCDINKNTQIDPGEDWRSFASVYAGVYPPITTGSLYCSDGIEGFMTLCDAINPEKGNYPWLANIEKWKDAALECDKTETSVQKCPDAGTSDATVPKRGWRPDFNPGCTPENTVFADGTSGCADGIDNDFDNLVDCNDRLCDGLLGPDGQICEFQGELNCQDKQDDDGDTLIDCSDPDCIFEASCRYESPKVAPHYQALLCLQGNNPEYPQFQECCGASACSNTDAILLGAAKLYGPGTTAEVAMDFNELVNSAILDKIRPIRTTNSIPIQRIVSAGDTLEFDYITNNPAGSITLTGTASGTYSLWENTVNKPANFGIITGYWWHVRIPMDTSGEILSVKFTAPAYVDNIQIVPGDAEGEQRYCSYGGSWNTSLVDPATCNSVVALGYGSYGWTGTMCCGDNTNEEYYKDSNAGCFARNTIYAGQRVGDVLHNTSLNNLLYYDGKFWACVENVSGLSRAVVGAITTTESRKTPSFTIKSQWYCDPDHTWKVLKDLKVENVLAGKLADMGDESGKSYTLFCDDEQRSINNVESVNPSTQGAFCVLTGPETENQKEVFVGFVLDRKAGANINDYLTSLQENYVPEWQDDESEMIPADYCDDVTNPNVNEFFEACTNGGVKNYKVYYNKAFGIVIIGREPASTNWADSMWRAVRNFFRNIFGYVPPSLGRPVLPSEIPSQFEKLYLHVQDGKSIVGAYYNNAFLVNYTNYDGTAVRRLASANGLTYDPSSNTIYSKPGDLKAWQQVTSALRPR